MNHGLSDRQITVLKQILSLYAEEIDSVDKQECRDRSRPVPTVNNSMIGMPSPLRLFQQPL